MEAWVVIFWIICGLGAAAIATNKGYGACGWFIAGMVFGPIAVLVIGFMGPNDTDKRPKKKCPYCAEIIQADAAVCRYCKRDLYPVKELPKPSSLPLPIDPVSSDLPICSQCGTPMLVKKATSGLRQGELFYVCPNFRTCGQVFPVELDEISIEVD